MPRYVMLNNGRDPWTLENIMSWDGHGTITINGQSGRITVFYFRMLVDFVLVWFSAKFYYFSIIIPYRLSG